MSSTTTKNNPTDHLSNVLSNELKPGETVLWQGQPVAKTLLVRRFKKLKWAFLSLCLLFFFFLTGHQASEALLIRYSLWGTLFLLISCQPFRLYFSAKKWLYVITDQRIVVIEIRRGTVVITTYPKVEISESSLIKKYGTNGLGDLLFRGKKTYGMIAIKDAAAVAAIIEKTFYQTVPYVQH